VLFRSHLFLVDGDVAQRGSVSALVEDSRLLHRRELLLHGVDVDVTGTHTRTPRVRIVQTTGRERTQPAMMTAMIRAIITCLPLPSRRQSASSGRRYTWP